MIAYEIHPDGRNKIIAPMVVLRKVINNSYSKSEKKRGFSDCRVSDKKELE